MTLREEIPVVGIGSTLNYGTHRVRGRAEFYQKNIRISSATIPASLQGISLEVEVAGRQFVTPFAPAPNLTTTFVWDGLDAFGREVQGRQPLKVTVTYAYKALYGAALVFGQFGPTASLTGDPAREEIYLSETWNTSIGAWDARGVGLGGWTLSDHHFYDSVDGSLHLGNGERRTVKNQPAVLNEVLNGVITSPRLGDTTPDGSVYVATLGAVNLVSADGANSLVAGDPTITGYSGDGGPATAARFDGVRDIARGPDGSLYLADENNQRVRKIDPNGVVTTFAGNGTEGTANMTAAQLGDGGPATSATLRRPRAVAWGPDNALYVAVGGRVRRIDQSGKISTVAGRGGFPNDGLLSDDGIDATEARISPTDLAFAPDGTMYIASPTQHAVFSVRNGKYATVVRGIPGALYVSGQSAIDTGMYSFGDIEISEAGEIYLSGFAAVLPSIFRHFVAQLTTAGTLSTVAGAGGRAYDSAGQFLHAPAVRSFNLRAQPYIAFSPRGFYLAHYNYIGLVSPALPELAAQDSIVASEDGAEVYVFDYSGRHLETRSGETGALLRLFSYDDNGLSGITDAFGNALSIERSGATPTAIVGAFGQRTTLQTNSEGFLTEVVNPAGEATSMTYYPGGLIETMTDARGGTSTLTYDELGRIKSDVSADGATQTLIASGDKHLWSVQHISGEGRTTTYGLKTARNRDEVRSNTLRDGTTAQAAISYDQGTSEQWLADGSYFKATSTPDPRFGMHAPIASTTVTLPSGLTRVEDVTKEFFSLAPNDPFDYTSERIKRTVNGKTWQEDYTRSTRTRVSRSPQARTVTTVEDELGRVLQQQRRGIHTVSFSYDSFGRFERSAQGNRTSTSSYFGAGGPHAGFLASVTNAASETVAFTRDAAGRPLSETYADSNQTTFAWDKNGNLTLVQPPGKPAHDQLFTSVNQLEVYAPPAAPGVTSPATTYTYDRDRLPLTEL
ncbi:MAG: hypothetical protein RJA70_4966, partial [Pseudomonadota bacterium]